MYICWQDNGDAQRTSHSKVSPEPNNPNGDFYKKQISFGWDHGLRLMDKESVSKPTMSKYNCVCTYLVDLVAIRIIYTWQMIDIILSRQYMNNGLCALQ